MNTKQLSYILVISEEKTLSAAAKRLGISQPALSKYLFNLEDELGTELFLRHNKHYYLTSAGKIYADAAAKIINVKDQTYQMIHSLSEEYTKTITVGVTPLRGAAAMATIFNQFHKRYPNVKLELKEDYQGNLRQAVINNKVNMALGTCIDLEDSQISYYSAHEENLILFVPSFHPLAKNASQDFNNLTYVDIKAFQDTPFIIGKPGSTIRKFADFIFSQNNMSPTIVYESDNNLILKRMAQNGAGATFLAEAHMEETDKLVYFRLMPNHTMHLAVMVPLEKQLSEEERYLIALNFASENGNTKYHFNPNEAAQNIINEFKLSEKMFFSHQ